MAQILSPYSLTDYTDFRKLQFDYFRVKQQNQELKTRLIDAEMMYENIFREFQYTKTIINVLNSEKDVMIKEQAKDCKDIQKQLCFLSEFLSDLQLQEKNFYRKERNNSNIVESVKNFVKIVQNLGKQYSKNKKILQQLTLQESKKQQQLLEKQQRFSQQIACLQLDLQSLSELKDELQSQNQQILQQNQQLRRQIKSYKTIALQARNQKAQTQPNYQDEHDSDKDFVNDSLTYQKELLSRVFASIVDSFQNSDLQFCLNKIYEVYEEVVQSYIEKLNCEYNLINLECEYKKLKSQNGEKEYITQLRRKINQQRKLLFQKKDDLHEKQQILQQKINDLSGQAVHDNRLKNFSLNLHSKLKKSQKEQQKLKKQNNSSIQFKHTLESDQMLQKIIEKDRQNLQKMLKQTRTNFRK